MFENLIENFVRSAIGLSKALTLTEVINKRVLGKQYELMVKFIDEKCSRRDAEDEKIKIPSEHVNEYWRLQKATDEMALSMKAISNSYIVTLISQYDVLIAGLIRELYMVIPELLSAGDRTVTLDDLLAAGSIDEVKTMFIERDVDAVLRESHIEQLKWFEKKLGISIRDDKDAIARFVELTERRNLCVHTNGIVSSQYLECCHDFETSVPDCLKIGDTLDVDIGYFDSSVNTILEIAVKLVHFMWKKVMKNKETEIVKSLNKISYSLIQDSKYSAAANIIAYSQKVFGKTYSREEELINVYNMAQCHLWMGNREKCVEMVEALDLSAIGPRFILPTLVLKSQYKEAFSLMRSIGDSGQISRNEYYEWPILRELRQQEEFAPMMKEIWGEHSFIERSKIEIVINEIMKQLSEYKPEHSA